MQFLLHENKIHTYLFLYMFTTYMYDGLEIYSCEPPVLFWVSTHVTLKFRFFPEDIKQYNTRTKGDYVVIFLLYDEAISTSNWCREKMQDDRANRTKEEDLLKSLKFLDEAFREHQNIFRLLPGGDMFKEVIKMLEAKEEESTESKRHER